MNFLEMITYLGDRLDDSDHTTWSLAHKKNLLNLALLRVVSRLYEQGVWSVPSYAFSTVANTAEYDLPADFYLARFLLDADDYEIPLTDVFSATTETGEPTEACIVGAYSVSGTTTNYAKIRFNPVPDGVYNYTLWYNPAPPAMTEDTDIPPVPEVLHELIALEAGVAALKNKGFFELISSWVDDCQERWEFFMESVSSRQRGQSLLFKNVLPEY